jgi:hypothetical protein
VTRPWQLAPARHGPSPGALARSRPGPDSRPRQIANRPRHWAHLSRRRADVVHVERGRRRKTCPAAPTSRIVREPSSTARVPAATGPLFSFFGVLGLRIYGEILAGSTFLPTDPTVRSRRLQAAVNSLPLRRPRRPPISLFRGWITRPTGSLSTLRRPGRPDTTQDSLTSGCLPLAGIGYPVGSVEGFRLASQFMLPPPRLVLTQPRRG